MARTTNEERLMKLETQMTDVKVTLCDMKTELKDISNTLQLALQTKVDKHDFEEYKKSSASWLKWATPTIISLVTLAILILRG